ncbi:probable maltase-glucoamylase 2 [Ornithodoros turicata]|uniref:probable maltase-glucoamylase 2 n=1 Tax=Ornithodoros turicata TaxID=34597 RepID=UPI003138C536
MADDSAPKLSLEELEKRRLQKLCCRRIGTVFGVLLLCFVVAFGLPLVMELYVLPNWISAQEQCGLGLELRISCRAILNSQPVTESSCHAAGCCWISQNDTEHCYHKFPSSVGYYIANCSNPADIRLSLQLGPEVNDTFLRGIKGNIRVLTRPYSRRHVHIFMSSAEELADDNENFFRFKTYRRYNLTDTEYVVTYSDSDGRPEVGKPFYLKVRRRSQSNKAIVNTRLGTLIFTEDSVEFTTVLPSFHVYGLGLTSRKSLRLEMPATWTLLSHSGGSGAGWPGTYASYVCVESGGLAHGVLIPTKSIVEVETTGHPAVTFRILRAVRLDLHVFVGSNPFEVIREMINFIGRPALPPMWALGFHACRYDVNKSHSVVQGMRAKRIPQESDCIGTSLGAEMGLPPSQQTESWQKTRLLLSQQSQKLLLFLTPHVPVVVPDKKAPYTPYTDGLKEDVFIKKGDGEAVIGTPEGTENTGGYVVADVFSPNYEQWLKKDLNQLSFSLKGFHGLVLDQNTPLDVSIPEPSTAFKDPPPYSTRCANNSVNFPLAFATKELLFRDTICMDSVHQTQQGRTVYHVDVHNAYGLRQTQVIRDVIRNKNPSLRTFIASVSSTTTTGRYAGHFGTDYGASWDMLEYSLVHMQEMSMFGAPLYGSAVCGSYGAPTYDLCSRWYQLSAWTPLMFSYRNAGQIDVDPYSSPKVRDVARLAIQTRYTLLEYMYTHLKKFSDPNGPLFVRPMFLEFPEDETALEVTRQFLLGPALMVAPVVNANTSELDVYFPRGVFYDFFNRHRERTLQDSPGWTRVISSEYQTAVYVRGGHVVPLRVPGLTVAETRAKSMSLVVALRKAEVEFAEEVLAEGEIYMDDGILESPSNVLNVTLQLLGRKKGMHTEVTYTLNIRPVSSFILMPEVNVSVNKIVFLGMRARPTRIVANTMSSTCDIPSENCIYKEDTDVLILTKLWMSCGIDLANWREIAIEATQARL